MHRTKSTRHRRIVLPLRAVTGTYKVMLHAFRKGGPLPETAWSDGGKRLTVTWPDGKQVYDFATGNDGRTRFVLKRDGKPVTTVK